MNARSRLSKLESAFERQPPDGAAIIRWLDRLPEGAERQRAIRELSDAQLLAVRKNTEAELGFSLSEISDDELEALCRGDDSPIQRVIDKACGR